MEYPILLTCGCIAGSLCLERSFKKSPRCPICNTTIRVIAGVDAPLNQNTGSYLRQLELSSGVNDWPLPSIESQEEIPHRAGMREAEQTINDPQDKLGVLNGCHDTFLSMRELEICISLVDYRLGTRTHVVDVLDAFMKYPLFDPSHWERMGDVRAYLEGKSKSTNTSQGKRNFQNATYRKLKDLLILVNLKAGTAILLYELEMVVSLMNFVHGSGVGLVDVLGMPHGELYDVPDSSGSEVADTELIGAFRTLDIHVGSMNTVKDLRDLFSQARL